jgi:Uma2 family endonuclease
MNTHFQPPGPPKLTQAAEGLMRRCWTVAEVETMVTQGIMSADERVELIGGELVPMSPKGSRHESIKGSLFYFWLERRLPSYRIMQETTFRLDEINYFEPDFVFYDSNVKLAELAPSNTYLAVEVSDTTLAFDKGRKARIYANFGVKVLWVIDVNTLETHVFEHPGIDGYREQRVVGPSDILVPDFAPELAVKLSELTLI